MTARTGGESRQAASDGRLERDLERAPAPARSRPRHLLRTLLKHLLFGSMARLPVDVAVRVVPRFLQEPFTRYLVAAGHRKQGGEFLAATMLRATATGARSGKSVLIGGPARVGKSQAARKLGERLGYSVLNTDHLHGWQQIMESRREEFRDGWVSYLLGATEKGVIVEGALLVLEGRKEVRHARVCLDDFERWCREFDAVGFVVGCAEGDRIRRLRAVEGHLDTCWTVDHTRRERWKIVRLVTFQSTVLRRQAIRHGVDYRELSSEAFDADIESLVAEAAAAVRSEDRHTD